MGNFVKYKGKTNRFLINGKCYEVESFDYVTNEYSLKNVEGKYLNCFFEEIPSRFVQQKPTYIAFTKEMTKIGKESFVIRINKGKIEPVTTSEIKDISYLGGDIYRLETENSVYITEITE